MDTILRRLTGLALGAALAFGPAVTAVRAATIANDDAYEMNENGTLVIDAPGVLANDESDGGAAICVAGYDYPGTEGHVETWGTDGSFTFTPWEHWNGTTSFVYGMKAGDGQCIGQADDQGLVIVTVHPVNDQPTAVVQGGTCDDGVTVEQDSGPFDDAAHCVENHNWGQSLDELTQLVDEWVVTTDRPDLFFDKPSIAIFQTTFGRLSFTPAPGAHGTATVTVRSRDNGGTARGGDDLSPPVEFTITITKTPTPEPTQAPPEPTETPTEAPSDAPSAEPSASDGGVATESPSMAPTEPPIGDPTGAIVGTVPWALLSIVALAGVLTFGGGVLLPRYLGKRRSP
ncbi:MAG TPA: Ig-like domain-containing protein [Candidatus Limnocylindrales bacterium]